MQISTFIQNGALQVLNIIRRFYMVIFSVLIGEILIFLNWDYFVGSKQSIFFQENTIFAILSCILGISLFLSLHLYAEKNKLTIGKKAALFGLGTLILVLYACTQKDDLAWNSQAILIKFFLLLLAFHGFVTISTFNRFKDVNSFWNFNYEQIIRLIISGFYTAILFLGLAGAIAVLNILFKLNINEQIYPKLWVFLVGIYNTFMYLSGFKKDLNEYKEKISFNPIIKIFVLYVLFPLILVYLAILYVYMGKIVLEWSLPNGIVSGMVIWFGVASILAYLLLFPLRNDAKNKFIKLFFKLFFILLLPLIVLLGISIYTRVSEYGLTIPRYLVFIIAGWLLLISIYFNISKKDNIIIIPFSLTLLLLLINFGPWNIRLLPENSQVKLLNQKFLAINLNTKTLQEKQNSSSYFLVSSESYNQISNIVSYLNEFHGYNYLNKISLKPWNNIYNDLSTNAELKDMPTYLFQEKLLNTINIKPEFDSLSNQNDTSLSPVIADQIIMFDDAIPSDGVKFVKLIVMKKSIGAGQNEVDGEPLKYNFDNNTLEIQFLGSIKEMNLEQITSKILTAQNDQKLGLMKLCEASNLKQGKYTDFEIYVTESAISTEHSSKEIYISQLKCVVLIK